tara:strand:+ start:544 stop:1077 length:534 start_codon:yes stop_codon:yes gene_type:complete
MAKKRITSITDNSKWVAPKVRKKRKPMTDEQKAAASERLAKAREVRAAKNPDYGKGSFHESLRDLPTDHQLHPDKVKKWMKTQKELAAVERAGVKKDIKGAIARLADHEGYVREMQGYLKHGDWTCMFYGEYQEKKIRSRNVALGYHWFGPNIGKPKRDVGTFYPDLGMVWEEGMTQ